MANQPECSPAIEAALRYAVGKGCFVTVAAATSSKIRLPPFSTNRRACSRKSRRAFPAWSRRGGRIAQGPRLLFERGSYIELAAPGVGALFGSDGFVRHKRRHSPFTDRSCLPASLYRAPRSDVFRYIRLHRHAMAAPHVAGGRGMLMQQGVTTGGHRGDLEDASTSARPGATTRSVRSLVDARAACAMGLAK